MQSKKVRFCTVFFTATAYFILTVVFKYILTLLNLSVVRPISVMLPVCGLLFGFWGAFGCAIGNFFADLVGGTDLITSAISIFIQTATSYMTYVLWYSRVRKKGMMQKSSFPSLAKSYNVLRYGVTVFITSVFCAFMIGFLTCIFESEQLFANRTIIVFFNQFIFGILLGFPLLAVLTKLDLPFVTPRRFRLRKSRKNRKACSMLSNVLLVLSFAMIIAAAVMYRYFDLSIKGLLCIFILITIMTCAALWLRPLFPCRITKNSNTSIITLNEKMVISFTMLGVVISVLIGVMGYCEHSAITDDLLHIWEDVCLNISIAMICYFALAVVALKSMEKGITLPVNEITDAVSKYDTNNYAKSSTQIIKKCKRYESNKTEISKMAASIVKMLTDIGIYTEDIKIKTEERQRVKSELEISSKIQLGILPHNFDDYTLLGADIYADMIPAKTVGGDFYDFFKTDDGKIAVVIADVSGKGVPAAMFMSMTKMVVEMYLVSGKTPSQTLTLANKYICEHNSADMFVTAFVGVYDCETGEFTYSNAGHNPPVLCKNGKPEFMKLKAGFMLGSLDFITYEQDKIVLTDNDSLFLYTDGVTEGNDKNGEFFGEQRLLDIFENSQNMTSYQMVNSVEKSAYDFSEGIEQFDDMTMLALKPSRCDGTSLNVEAVTENLPEVLSFVTKYIPKVKEYDKLKNAIELVCEEIFVNICNYAYEDKKGDAKISLKISNKGLKVSFVDSGKPFDPLAKDDADVKSPLSQRQIGGLGIYLVKELTDELYYSNDNETNKLTFIKYLT